MLRVEGSDGLVVHTRVLQRPVMKGMVTVNGSDTLDDVKRKAC